MEKMKRTLKVDEPIQNHSQKQQKQVKKLVQDVLDYGDLLIIANKGIGKTNTLQVLASAFRKQESCRIIIFEDFPKHALEFEQIPFMIIKDSDVIETRHTIDMENYFLRHERDYSVLKGQEIEQALKHNKDLIFVSEIQDIERQAFFIYSIVNHFYRKAYLRAYKNYNKHERIIFIIEESQNVFDSSTISKKLFNRLRKIFSVARNLGLHFVLASQRAQDINTKIRGRTRLLIGQVSLDDYELKIRRLLRHSKYRKEVLTLKRGSFLYPHLDLIINFPRFQSRYKPYLFQIPEQPKPERKGLWQRIKEAFTASNEEDEDETGVTFEDEDLIDEDLFDEDEL